MMENSSDSKATMLQRKLVQCCIDFINENDDETIETVSFNADNLQLSAKAKTWQPGTDSFCRIETYNEKLGRYEIDSESY